MLCVPTAAFITETEESVSGSRSSGHWVMRLSVGRTNSCVLRMVFHNRQLADCEKIFAESDRNCIALEWRTAPLKRRTAPLKRNHTLGVGSSTAGHWFMYSEVLLIWMEPFPLSGRFNNICDGCIPFSWARSGLCCCACLLTDTTYETLNRMESILR